MACSINKGKGNDVSVLFLTNHFGGDSWRGSIWAEMKPYNYLRISNTAVLDVSLLVVFKVSCAGEMGVWEKSGSWALRRSQAHKMWDLILLNYVRQRLGHFPQDYFIVWLFFPFPPLFQCPFYDMYCCSVSREALAVTDHCVLALGWLFSSIVL